jgi:hypothetical protein
MYKKLINPMTAQTTEDVILRLSDNAFIPFDPANIDYQQYLKFLEEGGQPLPADDNGQAA